MPIVDHYIPDPEVERLCDEAWRALQRHGQTDIGHRSAGLLSQRAIIEHHFERLDDECKARALRTVAWIDDQCAALPNMVYADAYLGT